MIVDLPPMKNSDVRLALLSVDQGTDDPLEPTIFHERWWLDLATDGQCRFAEVSDKYRVVGRFPYFIRKRNGLSFLDLPPLTHFLGPAVAEGDGRDNRWFLRRLDVTRQLIEQIPKTSGCYIKCHRDVNDVLAFQNQAFRSSVQFTHEVPPAPIEHVWAGMRDKGRNGVRTAAKSLTIDHDIPAAEFIAFYGANLAARGHENVLDMGIAGRLIAATLARARGAIFGVRDPSGTLAAAIFCVWDTRSYYYLMSTRTESAHRGATSLLLWEAISEAMRRGLIFDFDGITSEGGARLAANFTSTVTPRYIATRESRAIHFWRALKVVGRSEKTTYFL